MRGIGSFYCPEHMFISRGAAEGNKRGKGAIETAFIPKNQTYFNCFLYRYNTFMSIYFHLLSFNEHVNLLCDPASSGLCYGLSPTYEEFCRILDKTLSTMAPNEINASIHTHI